MGKPIKVDSASWDQEVLRSPQLVMVDFWAEWCGPCRMIAPIIEELSDEYDGRVKVCKLNTDENADVAARYQIMGIPTLLFVRDGKVLDKVVGAAQKKHLKEKVEILLAQ